MKKPNNTKKMKLSDLKPGQSTEIKLDNNFTPDISIKPEKPVKQKRERLLPNQRVDWRESDNLFYGTCQKLLGYPLAFTRMLIQYQIDKLEGIDAEYIKQTAKNITVDSETLIAEYNGFRTEYEKAKTEYKYEEDAMMAKLALTEQCQEWVGRFEELVVIRINDCIEYIEQFTTKSTQEQQPLGD